MKGWEQMEPTKAAHLTQRNADPNHYTQFWDDAEAIFTALYRVDLGAVVEAFSSIQCAAALGGPVTWPVPANLKGSDRKNFGDSGARWSSTHTGTDFSVPCGTPVYAMHAGTVVVDGSHGWAGPQLVGVEGGDVTSWYAHMQSATVTSGQLVKPGDEIGRVGSEGNSTGCHVHVEVRDPSSSPGSTTGAKDPSAWLAQNVGKATQVAKGSATGPGVIRVATFNALGHHHTAPGGGRAGWPDSDVRTKGLARYLSASDVQLVGLQEFQAPQQRTFQRLTGGAWHGAGNTDNVVMWRADTFTLVGQSTLDIPYFRGKTRLMPVVRLRHIATGTTVVVINVHNPADAHGPAAKWRKEAIRRERQLVADLRRTMSDPILLLGDFNDREGAYCPLTSRQLMTSPAGGSNGSGACRPPLPHPVDWIFGDVPGFGGYAIDKSVKGRLSDHPFVSALLAIKQPAAS